jgi:hypothetical protein
MGATPSKISNENPMQNTRFKRTNATRRLRINQNSRLRKTNATRKLNILKTSQFKGPLCDPIGFSQHTGECWHDTMLQMLFFSDGLKEITQPLFYNLKNAEIYNYIRSKNTTNELFINAIAKYIISIRDRFVNHYNYINDPDMDLVCNPKEGRNLFNYMKKEMKPSLVQMKRNESMKLGIMSANMALRLTAEKNNKWKKNLENILSNSYTLNTIKPHGATLDASMKVLSMILTLFNLQYGIIKHSDVDFDPFKYVKEYREVAGLYVSGNLYSASESSDGYDYYLVYDNLYKYYGRHAVGFIKCNNVWSYFDDNYGLMNANVGGRLLHIIKRDYINEKKHIEFMTCYYLDEDDNSIQEINCHLIKSFIDDNGGRVIDKIYYKMDWISFDEFLTTLNSKGINLHILHIFIVNNQHKNYNINDNTISFLMPEKIM